MTITDTRKGIGQLFMCGFHGLEPTKGIIDLIENHNLGSVILFSRNIESPEQVARLTRSLQDIARKAGHKRPLFIAVDQENGVVRRLGKSGTYLPGNMGLGALGSATAAKQVAKATSEELLALGINWNLAPVVDVNNNALNPVIGVRSYSEDPNQVARLGRAQVEGYQEGKVATSIKHFPGHGDTATDSHLGVPVIDKTREELEQVELVPFRQLMSTATSVMVAHMKLPRLGASSHVSSLSPAIVRDMLRKDMGYNGVIITDCLEMDAVKETVGVPNGSLLALQAGNDIVMISHTYEFQRDAFAKVKQEIETVDNIEARLERVAKLKDRFLSWDNVFDNLQPQRDSSAALSKMLYDRIPTIVRNRSNVLPMKPKSTDRVLFLAAHVPTTLAIDSEKEPFNSFYSALQQQHANVEYIIYDEDSSDMSDTISQADWVIVGTANANLHPFQARMVQLAHNIAKDRLAVVAVINPYDLTVFQDVDTYVVTYEYTPPAHEAAVRTLFDATIPSSKLPISLPNLADADTTPVSNIETYNHQNHFKGLVNLWNDVYGADWPLTEDKIDLVLNNTQNGKHWVATDVAGYVIGFVATQMVWDESAKKDTGEILLLAVSSLERNRGVGSQLHKQALTHLQQHDLARIRLGSAAPRFFPGIPQDDASNEGFFARRGWKLDSIVWDLKSMGDALILPEGIMDRMQKEDIHFAAIRPEDIEQLYTFQQRYFPFWLSTYKHHAALGDYQDLIVARENNDTTGRIVGSLLVYTTGQSNNQRTDLIWTDDKLFGKASGGMACVGVASEERGRGIGLGLVAYANQLLKERGVTKAYVDWVELLDFYRRAGYEPWRSYRMATRQ
ncbi:glycoside hydrolase, partial [Lichtheimia hyalospora FSU 10163]